MHCDTVTVCFDGGLNLRDCDLQISAEKLNRSDCAAQCFALFTQGDGAALRFGQYLGFYSAAAPENFRPVTDGRDLAACISGGSTGAILTVENLGFIGDDLQKLEHLASAGVKMASLVWNYENSLAYPNSIFRTCRTAARRNFSRAAKSRSSPAIPTRPESAGFAETSRTGL